MLQVLTSKPVLYFVLKVVKEFDEFRSQSSQSSIGKLIISMSFLFDSILSS